MDKFATIGVCVCVHTMISSKAVDDSEVLPQRTLVLVCRKSGSYFALLCSECFKVVDRQEQMVRSHLASDWETHHLGTLYHLNLPATQKPPSPCTRSLTLTLK